MIKKWNNFINESVSEKELSDLKDKAENFIGEKEMNLLLNDNKLYIVVQDVLKYAECRYDDTSKEIANWYEEIFGEVEGWVGSSWRDKLRNMKYGDKAAFISKAVDFYNIIKDEMELTDSGYSYAKESNLAKDIELICLSSLDKVEFWEVYENFSNVVVICGVKKSGNVKVYLLDDLSEELIPMCKRIESELNLKNISMEFQVNENYFSVVLGFALS